jgi:hypothetical protein
MIHKNFDTSYKNNMYNFKEKPLVAYISYEPLGFENLERFINSYKKFNSGYEHDLLICFKQFDAKKLSQWERKITLF